MKLTLEQLKAAGYHTYVRDGGWDTDDLSYTKKVLELDLPDDLVLLPVGTKCITGDQYLAWKISGRVVLETLDRPAWANVPTARVVLRPKANITTEVAAQLDFLEGVVSAQATVINRIKQALDTNIVGVVPDGPSEVDSYDDRDGEGTEPPMGRRGPRPETEHWHHFPHAGVTLYMYHPNELDVHVTFAMTAKGDQFSRKLGRVISKGRYDKSYISDNLRDRLKYDDLYALCLNEDAKELIFDCRLAEATSWNPAKVRDRVRRFFKRFA